MHSLFPSKELHILLTKKKLLKNAAPSYRNLWVKTTRCFASALMSGLNFLQHPSPHPNFQINEAMRNFEQKRAPVESLCSIATASTWSCQEEEPQPCCRVKNGRNEVAEEGLQSSYSDRENAFKSSFGVMSPDPSRVRPSQTQQFHDFLILSKACPRLIFSRTMEPLHSHKDTSLPS